jgi:hypothetical protein
LLSDSWHKQNPEAATHLFGFRSWGETKRYIWALWPTVTVPGEDERDKRVPLSEFEQCLITKMRFRRAFKQHTLGLIWGRSVQAIGRYVATWSPKWGLAGRHLSNLGISAAWLDHSLPVSYKAAKLFKICAVPHGKCVCVCVCVCRYI